MTISLAIPIVGILLISALIVVPVVTALQFKKSFRETIIIAERISIISRQIIQTAGHSDC
jgi:zinc transport system permease protein